MQNCFTVFSKIDQNYALTLKLLIAKFMIRRLHATSYISLIGYNESQCFLCSILVGKKIVQLHASQGGIFHFSYLTKLPD